MEVSFSSLKAYIPAIVTMLSMFISGFFFLSNYLNANFVSMREFDKYEAATTSVGLENQKHILENKLYFLQMCRASLALCSYKSSIDTDIEAALRELQDVRGRLENYKRQQTR